MQSVLNNPTMVIKAAIKKIVTLILCLLSLELELLFSYFLEKGPHPRNTENVDKVVTQNLPGNAG